MSVCHKCSWPPAIIIVSVPFIVTYQSCNILIWPFNNVKEPCYIPLALCQVSLATSIMHGGSLSTRRYSPCFFSLTKTKVQCTLHGPVCNYILQETVGNSSKLTTTCNRRYHIWRTLLWQYPIKNSSTVVTTNKCVIPGGNRKLSLITYLHHTHPHY